MSAARRSAEVVAALLTGGAIGVAVAGSALASHVVTRATVPDEAIVGQTIQIPVALAVEWVFDGLEEMGFDRETRYDEEFVAEKHRKLREAGWTVISTAAPSSAELATELETLQDQG